MHTKQDEIIASTFADNIYNIIDDAFYNIFKLKVELYSILDYIWIQTCNNNNNNYSAYIAPNTYFVRSL